MTTATATNTEVLGWAALLIVAVVGVIVMYRGMQRPRLTLRYSDGAWRADRRAVAYYLASIVPLLLLWWTFFLVAVSLITTLDARSVGVVSAAIVVAVRVLAHVWTEAAHELAKTVPLTLVVLLLVNRDVSTAGLAGLRDPGEVQTSQSFGLIVLVAELLAVTAWYRIGVRILAPRGWRVPGVHHPPDSGARTDGPVERSDLEPVGDHLAHLVMLASAVLLVIDLLAVPMRAKALVTGLIGAGILAGFALMYRRAATRRERIDAASGAGLMLLAVGAAAAHWLPVVTAALAALTALSAGLAFAGSGLGQLFHPPRAGGASVQAPDDGVAG